MKRILIILGLFLLTSGHIFSQPIPVLDMAEYIGIDDAGEYYTGTDVEAALQEIGAGTTLDDRYVPYTGAISDVDLGAYNITTTGKGTFGTLDIDSEMIYNGEYLSVKGGSTTWTTAGWGKAVAIDHADVYLFRDSAGATWGMGQTGGGPTLYLFHSTANDNSAAATYVKTQTKTLATYNTDVWINDQLRVNTADQPCVWAGGSVAGAQGMVFGNPNTAHTATFILSEGAVGSSISNAWMKRYGSTHATTPNRMEVWNKENAEMAFGTNNTEVGKWDASGNFKMSFDNKKFIMGGEDNVEMYYNNADFIVDPDAAGTGEVWIGVTADDTLRAAVLVAGKGILGLAGGHALEVGGTSIFEDAIYLTQQDGNEYIDSGANNYVDIGATISVRINDILQLVGITSDPTEEDGMIWYRSDVKEYRFRADRITYKWIGERI